MAKTLYLKDGTIEMPYDMFDFINLVEEYMGEDARRYLEDFINEQTDYELEADYSDLTYEKTGDESHDILVDVADGVEQLDHYLEARKIDRKKLKQITWELTCLVKSKL